ncbi:MAG: Rpn family recombination-promoting nuclease/putative transposase [Clostridium chrysemydis]|uniref:Rpn family recombination-promoting nuclease/putative transposase n=1 Tax=Clostridium chrysemydis TaxID=2665504 RepID=UPI003F3E6B4B
MAKRDFDAAWKTILEAFEIEMVELLFPEVYPEIDWNLGTESLDNDLREIAREIFDKDSSKTIISDKIIKVRTKNNKNKIIFIHIEVQSYSSGDEVFSERMFKYFYRLFDKFKYKNKEEGEIIAAAIYTYKGDSGKDKNYIYKPLKFKENILQYNFKVIDVEKMDLNILSEENPLKLVFKMAKKLLKTSSKDIDIFNSKIELAEELRLYDKVKNEEQVKALVDFLEYLFLIKDKFLEEKFEDYKKSKGGVYKMTVEEVRRLYYEGKGIEKGIEKGKIEGFKEAISKIIDVLDDKTISEKFEISIDEVKKIREERSKKLN